MYTCMSKSFARILLKYFTNNSNTSQCVMKHKYLPSIFGCYFDEFYSAFIRNGQYFCSF